MNKPLLLLQKSLLFTIALFASGALKAQNMALDWAKNIPANYTGSPSGFAWIYDFTTDDAGNSYVTGGIFGTVDMDPGPGVSNLISNGNSDIFILKLDPAGNFVWAKQVGNNAPLNPFSSSEMVNAIHVDMQGNVIIAGTFRDTLDMDPGPTVTHLVANSGGNGFDGFILKLDSAGNYVWAVKIGDAQDDQVSQITTDGSGNIYATGKFSGTVDFDPGPGTFSLSAPDPDIFVLKLDSSGAFQWATQLNAVAICWANGITLDQWGNTYIAGASTVPSPSCSFCSFGNTNVWKLDTSGNISWNYEVEATGMNDADDIVCDSSGNLYVSGYFSDTIDFDPGPGVDSFTNSNYPDKQIFILKLDTAGNPIWAKALRTSNNLNNQVGNFPHLALDAANNLVISGPFSGTTDFDPGPGTANLTAPGTSPYYNLYDIFLLKMDTAGNYKWAKSIGNTGMDYCLGIGTDAHGSLWCAGSFEDTVDFDPGPGITTLSPSGAFVFKLICNDTTAITVTDTACESYTLNGETYTESGMYSQVRPNAAGCDSIIRLKLTIPVLDPVITVNGFVLGTVAPYTTYQWFFNGAPISGATQATYTVSQNGDYTVAVTNERGCTDTSAIYTVTNVNGIADIDALAREIHVYPNPAQDQVYIQSPVAVNIVLSSIEGRIIREVTKARSLSVKDLAAGVYFIRITDKDETFIKTEKIVKKDH